MDELSREELIAKINDLENRLGESEHLIDAIKAGEVDAFAINKDDGSEIFTLQSGDYAYRLLIEEFGEGAINVGADGLILYTNPYFYNLLGLPYEQVIGSIFFDFIHPESQLTFTTLFETALLDKSKGEINLLANGKIIPVYVSLTTLRPKLDTVGIIITDFTEKKKNESVILQYQADLELKNKELLERNVELASFGYIASHDLQEPLRKIQLFSNRILAKEAANFTDLSVDHFNRIIAASDRMSKLINALLAYSRIDAIKDAFVETDLNKTLAEVKLNIAELINESNAVVTNNQLPTLQTLPYQFTQLFTNIISNAIKYSKPNIAPIINITATQINWSETGLPTQQSSNPCWKITITDNGIGFEPQYASQIFDLFKRLHGRDAYEGTGVGLAICKKIVQNHGGTIMATSEVDKGSSFMIYLPGKL